MNTHAVSDTQAYISEHNKPVLVWDIVVRGCHWILVFSFTIAYLTEDHYLGIHTYAGYTIFTLLVLRVIWGIIGSKYARFSNFYYPPATIIGFIKDTFQFRAKRYLGHNPAGGAMIFLLLVSLFLCTLSGMAVYAAGDQAGPVAFLFSPGQLLFNTFLWEDIWEEIHEFFANFLVFLIVIHITGVIVESVIHRENLVKAMISGYKKGDKQ